MSVYVDEMAVCLQTKNWPYTQACHLVADTEGELHIFAMRLGLHRSWFQAAGILHYDLTVGMRRKAVKLGAVELSRKKFAKFTRKYRLLRKKYRQRDDAQ